MFHMAEPLGAGVAKSTPSGESARPARPGHLTLPPSSSRPENPVSSGNIDPRPARFVAEGRRRKWLTATAVAVVIAIVLAAALVVRDDHSSQGSSGPTVVVAHQIYRTIPGGQYDAVDFVSPTVSLLNGTIEETWGNSVFYTMTPSDLLNLSIKGVVDGYAWTSGPVANHTTLHLNVTVAAGPWDLVFMNPQKYGVFGGNQTVIWFMTGVYLTNT